MAAMQQHGNLFALLGDYEDNDLAQIINRVTPNRSAPSEKNYKKKPQQQKNKKKQQSPKLDPEMLRAKPLVLPDHVMRRELVIRNSKKNGQLHASQDVVVAQKTQEKEKVEDTSLTLKEYEKVQAEKKNKNTVQSLLEGKEDERHRIVKKRTKKVITGLFSNQTDSESVRAVLGSQQRVDTQPALNFEDACQFPNLRGTSKA